MTLVEISITGALLSSTTFSTTFSSLTTTSSLLTFSLVTKGSGSLTSTSDFVATSCSETSLTLSSIFSSVTTFSSSAFFSLLGFCLSFFPNEMLRNDHFFLTFSFFTEAELCSFSLFFEASSAEGSDFCSSLFSTSVVVVSDSFFSFSIASISTLFFVFYF
jgi:hypothetical protein